jgi:perosamine synthetase
VQIALRDRGIATGRYFPPIHLQPGLQAALKGEPVSLPRSESISRRTLALPFFNRIEVSQQATVALALGEALVVAQR